MWEIFLSSTSADLAPYRAAVHQAISELEGFHCVWMEGFGARDDWALDLCRQKVRDCDLFIAILGLYHGSSPAGSQRSYTELEYEAAVEYRRSRLVFMTPDDFPLKGNLREPDEKWQRQQDFRRNVSLDRVRATFSSPTTLAREVVVAIYNWERRRATQSSAQLRAEALPAPMAEAAPDLGPLIPKMCDRTLQEDQFRSDFASALRERPGFPQIYVLCGEERECPETYIERLTKTHLQRQAARIGGDAGGQVLTRRVSWPEEGEVAERFQRLIANLFEPFDPTYEITHEELTPAAFAGLEPMSVNPVVTLDHELRPASGNEPSRELLERYLRFWDEVATHRPSALIVSFIWVLYPPVESGLLSPWRRRRRCAAFQATLAEIRQARERQPKLCPYSPLKELGCIKKEHVLEWFSRHHRIYDTKSRLEQGEKLFGSEACRPMAEIESALGRIQEGFFQRR